MYILNDKEFREGKITRAIFDNVLTFHVIQLGLQSQGVTHFVEKTSHLGGSIVLYSAKREWEPLTLNPDQVLLYEAALSVQDKRQRQALLKKLI